MECPRCGTQTKNPKFCSRKCSTQHAQEERLRKFPPRVKFCKSCELRLTTKQHTYCGSECASTHRRKSNQEKWLKGEIDGLRQGGVVTEFVKEWLRENRGNACELCGWDKVNPYTNKVPVVADHIDGSFKNNRPENLRLLCPSCDSLQSTYGGANRGQGRSTVRKPLDKSTVVW